MGSCSRAPVSAAPVDRAAAELDILEAVFRYQFDHNHSGRSPSAFDYVFLSLASDTGLGLPKDPPASLLARFKDHVPPVEPASGADTHAGSGMRSSVRHKQKGGRGILFFLTNIRWIDDSTVEVDGGSHSGCESENTYRAERRDGVWVVVRDDLHWIS
jgi:hypothetical protein